MPEQLQISSALTDIISISHSLVITAHRCVKPCLWQEIGVAVETNIGKPILALTTTILPRIARIFRPEDKGEVGKTIEGGGGWTDTRAGGILPLYPLISYYIAF